MHQLLVAGEDVPPRAFTARVEGNNNATFKFDISRAASIDAKQTDTNKYVRVCKICVNIDLYRYTRVVKRAGTPTRSYPKGYSSPGSSATLIDWSRGYDITPIASQNFFLHLFLFYAKKNSFENEIKNSNKTIWCLYLQNQIRLRVHWNRPRSLDMITKKSCKKGILKFWDLYLSNGVITKLERQIHNN